MRQKDRRRLRDIQRATGGGREAEVALEWLTQQQDSLAPEHLAGLNWLSGTLMARRRECENALDEELRDAFRGLADRLEQRLALMKSERNLLDENAHVSFAETLADRMDRQAGDLLADLGQIARMDDAAQLHDARIMSKRLRYLLEPVRGHVNEAQPIVKRCKRLQEVLGDLNDVHVLMDEIHRAFEASLQHKAARIRSSLSAGDIERARRDASMLEWAGLVELYGRLDTDRRMLIGKIRDRWLDADLDALVRSTRDLANELRAQTVQ